MTALNGTMERLIDDRSRDAGSLLSLLPSIVLHGAVAAAIWFGLARETEEVQTPVTFVSIAPPAMPAPPAAAEPEPLLPPPPDLLDYAPPPLPEIETLPFDPDETRPAPPVSAPEDAVPIEKKIEEKPKPKKPEAKAKPKPAAKPKPESAAKTVAAPTPSPSPPAETPAPSSSPAAAKSAPAAPTSSASAAAVSDEPVRVSNPNYAGACPIAYPERARKRNQEGTVVIHALIGPDGKPIEVTVAESSGHRLLDEAARDAIADCAFVPQRVGGQAVKAIVEIPIPFKLI